GFLGCGADSLEEVGPDLFGAGAIGHADFDERRLGGVLELHEVDVVGAQLAQGGGARPPDSQPADDRRLSHEELAFVGRRPALGDVELQKLVQEVDSETDSGAVENRLARPVENAHELVAVDAGNDGLELVGVGGKIEAADVHKHHGFGLLSNETWMNGSAAAMHRLPMR